ncbi:globin family protein [Paenibacillus xanthanilyticus]|uniref:Phycobilisome protein n=1 Tax=Paenibacillus xanthanilyticus TaxID=1783531 RepID=A0ABV8K7J0_9BACL
MNGQPDIRMYDAIIREVTAGIYEAYPELMDKYGEAGKRKCIEDNEHHCRYLETSLALRDDKVFTDYALWLNNLLQKRGMSADHVIDNFERIAAAVQGRMPDEKQTRIARLLQSAIRLLREEP